MACLFLQHWFPNRPTKACAIAAVPAMPFVRCFPMGPLMSEKFMSFFKLVGFSLNLVGNLVGISGIGCQISGI